MPPGAGPPLACGKTRRARSPDIISRSNGKPNRCVRFLISTQNTWLVSVANPRTNASALSALYTQPLIEPIDTRGGHRPHPTPLTPVPRDPAVGVRSGGQDLEALQPCAICHTQSTSVSFGSSSSGGGSSSGSFSTAGCGWLALAAVACCSRIATARSDLLGGTKRRPSGFT